MSFIRRPLLRNAARAGAHVRVSPSQPVAAILAHQAMSARSFTHASVPVRAVTRLTAHQLNTSQLRFYSAKNYPTHNLIAMPALSPTMVQGGIGAWQKAVGDAVNPGDVLVEIETDKAQMDFECQEEGYLAKILVETGTKDVPVGNPIAVFVEDEADVAAFADFTVADTAKAAESSPETPKQAAPAEKSSEADVAPVAAPQGTAPTSSDDRVKASPFAKKTASERGIDLAGIQGTGPNGRIIKDDVDNYKPAAPKPTAAAAPAPAFAQPPPAYAPQSATGDAYTDIPTTNMRRVIATRLSESKQAVPHYYITTEINMDKVEKLRKVLNSSADGQYKLSVNDFIIKAAALSLKKVPEVNSAWQGDFIRQYKSADISVAVATPTGLITPIVTGAENRGLADISLKVKDMAARARNGKLAPHEYQGGTFSISNLGMYGVKHFTAIINPPQSCILAVGASSQKVVPDETSERGFSVRTVMEVTLSSDHRVVDGAVGATWLQAFKEYMENPLKMML